MGEINRYYTHADIRDVASVIISSVLDSLDPPVWQYHGVGAGHNLRVGALAGPEVCPAVLVLHSVLVGIWLRRLLVWRGGTVWPQYQQLMIMTSVITHTGWKVCL